MTEKEALLLKTLKLMYQKFLTKDSKIGRGEVEYKVHSTLQEIMGEKEYEDWLRRLKFEINNGIIE